MIPFLDLLYEQVELSQTDADVSAANATEYTFSGKALGAAHTNRKIVVHITFEDTSDAGSTISSVVTGGISAGIVSDGSTSAISDSGSGDTEISALYIASVPTGTTGDVVVTLNEAVTNCSITIYRLINAATTAYHVQTDNTVTTNALSVSLNIPGFGAAVGGVHFLTGGSPATTTWTGLTEDVDGTVEADVSRSSASGRFASAQTGRTVTATASTGVEGALVAASFKPL